MILAFLLGQLFGTLVTLMFLVLLNREDDDGET